MQLVHLWKEAGSCAAFCISLGHLFFTEGVKQVDSDIQPLLSKIIQHHSTLSPRVLPSYSILYWFALEVYQIKVQVLEKGGMPIEDVEANPLLEHFQNVVFVTASNLQSWTNKTHEKPDENPKGDCNYFGSLRNITSGGSAN